MAIKRMGPLDSILCVDASLLLTTWVELMPLTPGTKLGTFEITASVGSISTRSAGIGFARHWSERLYAEID